MNKSRIYTAVNADEVKPGAIGYFGNTLTDLDTRIEVGRLEEVLRITGANYQNRFINMNGLLWALFYPVECSTLQRMVNDIAEALNLIPESAEVVSRLEERKILALHSILCEERHCDDLMALAAKKEGDV